MSFEQLFNMPFWKLVLLAIMDDIVLFCRLWPIWTGLTIIFIILKISIGWKNKKT